MNRATHILWIDYHGKPRFPAFRCAEHLKHGSGVSVVGVEKLRPDVAEKAVSCGVCRSIANNS